MLDPFLWGSARDRESSFDGMYSSKARSVEDAHHGRVVARRRGVESDNAVKRSANPRVVPPPWPDGRFGSSGVASRPGEEL